MAQLSAPDGQLRFQHLGDGEMTIVSERSSGFWWVASFGAAIVALAGPLALAAERDWATSDSVAIRYLTEDQEFTWSINPSATPAALLDGSGAIVWSPLKRYFYFISHSGDLACDCNRYTLTLYDAQQLASVLEDPKQRK